MSDRQPKFTLSVEEELFAPPKSLAAEAHVSALSDHQNLYNQSLTDPNGFWREIASQLHFEEVSENGLEYNTDVRRGEIFTRFMAGSRTNVAYNCLVPIIQHGHGDRVAYKWEGNDPTDTTELTFTQLLEQVQRFAAVLRSNGVRKGDVVAIYLPMVLELPIAMLACAWIGAPHSVVFAGFSADSLAERLHQARARVLITADSFPRGPKVVLLKPMADAAVELCAQRGHQVEKTIVVEHMDRVKMPPQQKKPQPYAHNAKRDIRFHEAMQNVALTPENTRVEWCDAEDPLFILYTSGSTGAPKGIVHSTAGYMTYAFTTMKYTFDAHPAEDVFWCTADGGWITGHTYLVYGPLLNGMTSVFFEGVPTHPTPARTWEVVEKYGVTKLYTSPTAVRSLMGFSERFVTAHDRSSLKVIGTVGEPINPTAWHWLHRVVGEQRAAIVDTYWQTETGGHIVTACPGAVPTKPGSATLPFFGVRPVLLDNDGQPIEGPGEGNLCLEGAWPGMSRTILGDHQRFQKTYFQPFPGYYFTGDSARRDEDGYYWIVGRVDDLMNVSGHLLSTAEIESALTSHGDVVEAAVVAMEHPVKGHTPYAFVVLRNEQKITDSLVAQLVRTVREKIGPIATPERIQHAPGLPKTRSGKVTRRILRKIAQGDQSADLGDTSTLIDSTVIDALWSARIPVRG